MSEIVMEARPSGAPGEAVVTLKFGGDVLADETVRLADAGARAALIDRIIADHPGLAQQREALAEELAGFAADGRYLDGAPRLLRLADVTPAPLRWLWPGRVPLGKVTLLAGDPGLGKSFVTLDVAARVSHGMPWPDAPDAANPAGGVVLLSAEDDAADTIRPRLDAAEADVSRIALLTAVRRYDAESRSTRDAPFDLSRDLPALEQAIDGVARCRLVVVDPVSAYLGGTDDHRNAELRSVLGPLAELAARRGVAIVCVTHLRKGSDGSALHRTIGSIAFVAAARAAWIVTRDADDVSGRRRLMLCAKSNLGPDAGDGLAYELRPANNGTAAVAWDATPVTMTADDALSVGRERDDSGGALDEATDWLRAALADGPIGARDVKARAGDDGIAPRTLDRAKQRLGVVAGPDGFGGRWVWRLPDADAQSAPSSPECAKGETLAHSGDDGALWGGDDSPAPSDANPADATGRSSAAVWPSAERLTNLPENVAALAARRDGWTPAGWRGWLLHLADACRTNNAARSAELREAADALDVPDG